MKIKGILCGILAVAMLVGAGSPAFAENAYVSRADDTGFTVTSDADAGIKLVVADYDDDGRLADAATMLADIREGDNSYTYADMNMPVADGKRKIMLWNGMEPMNLAAVVPVTVKYEAAMQAAVANGLISGYTIGEVNENITKAEVAAILVNAVGATAASAEGIADVEADAWYADSVSKAVATGAFELDSSGRFYPESNLTCQEIYKIVAKLFRFDGYKVYYASGRIEDIGAGDIAVLDNFADKDTIATWAVDYAAAIADNGGFAGFDGLLKGDSLMTKGEFAYLMDELIGTYIDKPGIYMSDDFDTSRSVVIRKGGVMISGLSTDRNLIVGYSVDTSGVQIMNSEINGATVIMGGADEENRTSCITLQGIFADVRVVAPWIKITAAGVKMGYYRGDKNSVLDMAPFEK